MTNITALDSCTYLGNSLTPCGCSPTVMGKSYCEEHVFLVYKQGTARAKRKKDLRVAAAVWDLEAEFNAVVEELIAEGYNFEEPIWEVEEAVEA